jgi:hypothetical protein
MRTIIHSTEAATASSTAGPLWTLLLTRGRPARLFKLLNLTQQFFRKFRYVHYECFIWMLHYVFGECAIRSGAQPFSDFILKILMIQGQNSDILVCVFIQNHVKAGMMRAQSCHWSIDRYARGCAYSVCVVFSSSFKFGASGILCVRVSGTGRKLQRHSHHASRCGRCGKRETRWPKTAATIVGLQVRPLQQRVWVAGRHGRSSQTQLVSKSMSLTARGAHCAGILRQHDTPGPRCVAHTGISLLIRQRAMLTSCSLQQLRIVQ